MAVFRFLASLKLAVVVILSLTASLAAGTLIESYYDIATGKYWVYRAFWFHFVLFTLGVNIVCSAFSRWPWKKRHLPFLLAHLGIIMVLVGSWVTQKWGLDGMLKVSEGAQSSIVELDQYQLQLEHAGQRANIDFKWLPPHVKFSPIKYPEYGFEIDQYLARADAVIAFEDSQDPQAALAMGLKIQGGPMQLDQQVWLWQGDPSWSQITLGPLKMVLLPQGMKLGSAKNDKGQALIEIEPTSKNQIRIRLVSVRGETKTLTTKVGSSLETGWMELKLTVDQFFQHAQNATQFTLSKNLYGDTAPPPAIHVKALSTTAPSNGMWMGLGDRVELAYGKQVLSMAFTQKRVMLPFGLELKEFHLDHYEGTMNPSSFRSDVKIVDQGEHEVKTISMNEPLAHRGITLYQASYVPEDPKPKTSIFSVNQDPGRTAKYTGSLILILGVLLLFGRRYLEKKKMEKTTVKNVALGLLLLLSTVSSTECFAELPKQASKWDWSVASEIPMQSGGRIKPLDSFARETVLYVTGSKSYSGWRQIEMMFSWMSDPESWANEPLIKIQNEDVKRQLMLDQTRNRYSANELIKNQNLIQYAEGLSKRERGVNLGVTNAVKPNAREQELKKILDRIGMFRTIVSGEALTLIPNRKPGKPWNSLATPDKESTVMRAIFAEMISSYQKGDLDYFTKLAITGKSTIEKEILNWGDSSPKLLSIEALYYRTNPFFYAMVLYLVAGLLWLVSTNKFATIGAWVGTLTAFALHAYGFTLRCIIAGRPPVSNMYESVIWVSFGVLLFAFILYFIQKQKLIPGVASVVAGLMLLAADASPAILDPNIHPLVPVLRSNYWLTIHVLTITLGYAGFALSLGIANVTLFNYFREKALRASGVNFTARVDHLNLMTYRAMQFGVAFLAAGTILGGVWADYSWGRFWGWDPKEVWALIALLTYIAILHGRFAGWVGSFGFAIWTTVSFLSVIMAWYGVNFVLGVGLHSYGFSTGGGVGVIGFVITQLSWVGIVTAVRKTATQKFA
ncbi:MAG: cytochrome c biogenesis protein CcsA [Xanthomonadaceae bacterium]|nr:cytochrome c biogenesis protein CcsA [Xanthomonadaceae bacterium]